MKPFFRFFLAFLGISLLAGSSLALDFFKQNNLVLPRTVWGDTDLSGMTRDEVREIVRQKIKSFTETPFQIAARGVAQEVTLSDLGVSLHEAEVLSQIPFAGGVSNSAMTLFSLAGQRIIPNVSIHRPEILRVIEEKFPDIPQTQNARFVLKKKRWEIAEAEPGVAPKIEPFVADIRRSITFLEHQPVILSFEEKTPSVFSADIEPYREAIQKQAIRPLKIFYEQKSWEIKMADHLDWIIFDKKPYEVAAGELPFSLQMDPVAFSHFVNEKLMKVLEQAPEDVRIWRDPYSKIQFDGRANDGRAIDRERLLVLINQALEAKNNETDIEIPLVVVRPKLEISEDLQALGIREIIGVGHTRFAGSPVNRIHNIGVGVARFNGLIIPPGETFSFNKNLGKVDASTGYRKELVIKPEGTIPDFGGGLCQVSSTIFRAAIYSGLPIVERAAHTYAVTYYSQIGGHGLDATIYPPARDLKFTNDTPGSILIQSYVDGVNAFFKFYGTSDSRTVSMEGPFISNRRAAPTEVLEVPDPKLPPGEKKQVEKPHAGFDALWYRRITKNGETINEKIFSQYKAVPAKFLIGGEVTPEGENSALIEANPFE